MGNVWSRYSIDTSPVRAVTGNALLSVRQASIGFRIALLTVRQTRVELETSSGTASKHRISERAPELEASGTLSRIQRGEIPLESADRRAVWTRLLILLMISGK